MNSEIEYPSIRITPFEEFQNSILQICINILYSYKVLLDIIPINDNDLKKYLNKPDHGKKKTKGITTIINELANNVNKKWVGNKQLVYSILSIENQFRKFFSSDKFQEDYIYNFALIEDDILKFVSDDMKNKIIVLVLKNLKKIKYCFSNNIKNGKTLSVFSNSQSMHSICTCEGNSCECGTEKSITLDELLHTNNIIEIYKNYIEYKKMFNIVKSQFLNINTFLINIYLLSFKENNKEIQSLFKSKKESYDYIINSGNFLYACETNNQKVIEDLLKEENISLNYFYSNRNILPIEYLFTSNRNKALLENILKNPAFNINATDNTGRSILHKLFNADTENPITQLILTQPYANYNHQDYYGDSLLMLSIESDNLELTKFLLNQPFININLTNRYGENALALAIEYKRENVIKLLLDRLDLDVNTSDSHGISILMRAIKYSISKDIIISLINHPNIDYTTIDKKGRSLLFYIINFNCTGVIDHLVKKGVDLHINKCLTTKDLPLNMAIKYSNKEIIKEILALPDLDINKIDDRGRTPLMTAIENEDIEAVQLLLENEKLIVNKNDRFKRIPLNYAADHNLLQIMEALIKHKDILINSKDADGKTSLMCASMNDNVKNISMLIENGADINIQDNNNYTALMYTIERNYYKSFNALINEKNINLNLINNNQQNALHLAVLTDNIGMVKKIVENESTDINFIGQDHKSALILAVDSKYCNDLADELLVRHDIDINIKDIHNNTALSLSIELNKPTLTKKILQFINMKQQLSKEQHENEKEQNNEENIEQKNEQNKEQNKEQNIEKNKKEKQVPVS